MDRSTQAMSRARMITARSELTTRRMLELTKAALQGTIPDENPFAGIDETDWRDVFEQSVVQGVMVLSLEGAMRLPKPLHPPHLLKLRWIAGVEAVEKRYLHQSETAKDLSSRFREHNIRMLLFKGLALSRLYPVPASREFGDLDIFLCGKAKEGDALLKQITSKNPVPSAKHVDYSYCGILIENHHYFLGRSFHRSDALEQRLMKILTEAGILGETDYRTDETLLFPPPDFDALFVTVHLLAHLPARIVLRFLCDLTVLFKAYKGKIDFHSYCDALAESKLLKLANVFISLSVRYLGLSPEDVPPYESDFSLEDRIWNDMFYPEVSPHANGKRNFFNVIIHKIRLLRSRRWKNELVFPGQYGKKILYTIIYHLRHPKLIGKPR